MEVFFLVFWGVLVSRSLVCSVPGGDCCFFSLLSFIFFSVSSSWECQASGGVLRYLWVGESRHATIQTCVHKPYCTRVPSCTLPYHLLCHSFDIRVLSSRGSFISPTGSRFLMKSSSIRGQNRCH